MDLPWLYRLSTEQYACLSRFQKIGGSKIKEKLKTVKEENARVRFSNVW